MPRPGYRLGLPRSGQWVEAVNTDSSFYGGTDTGNLGGVQAEAVCPFAGGTEHGFTIVLAGRYTTKAQALLYYLAMTGRLHTRAAVASLLWSEHGDEEARGKIRGPVCRILSAIH